MNLSDDLLGRLHIEVPDFSPCPFVLSIPEFQGQNEGKAFSIRQVFEWSIPASSADAEFQIDGDPSLIGLHVSGQVKTSTDSELYMLMKVANTQALAIQNGHTTLHLDTSADCEFADPDGERTFFFTDMSWQSAAKLHRSNPASHAPFRVGLNYGGKTLLWRMVARKNIAGDKIIALGLTRAYVFASDHSNWPCGLLAGSRWGEIAPGCFLDTRLGLYFARTGNLDEIQPLYMRDLKS